MTKQFYHESGKGSHARVRDVDAETFSNNWERIFGNKEKKQEEVCSSCKGAKGVFDCGWWYSCQQCSAHVKTGNDGQPLK